MYSLYIVWYIFLAGIGSGAYAVASIFGFAGRFSHKPHIQEYGRLAEGGFILGPILVAVGAVFLLFDLNVPARAYLALLSGTPTVLTVGVWLIVLFCPISATLLFARLHHSFSIRRAVETILQIIASILAIGLMTYTGVFLACLPSVPFHHNWLLVLLFILSSFATGLALIALYGFLNQHKKAMIYSLALIPKIDLLFIVLELLTLGAFVWSSLLGDGATRYSLDLLLFGVNAPLFWVGTVAVGLVVPMLLSIWSLKQEQLNVIAVNSLLVILGAFFLRYCLIESGIHIHNFMMLQ